jgi:enterochelin esterase family protein
MGEANRMSEIVLSYRAPSANVRSVRLRADAFKRAGPLEFRRRGRTRNWELSLPQLNGLARFEYQLEVVHADGTTEWICDPANPLRASAPFGDRSVLEFEDYEAPVWIEDEEARPGTLRKISIRSRVLRTDVTGVLWAAHGVEAAAALPLLVVHDGPEYVEHASLLRLFDSSIAELELRPFRAALLRPPGDRNETYSASTRYANALATEVVPALNDLAPTPDLPGARVAMGASLGALAAFHAHRVHRHLFGGLFLQSGSFFRRATDPQESGFPRFARISRFVGGVLRADMAPAAVPIVMTCGRSEENIANNRALRDALVRQRYDVRLHEHPDLHNWVSWRDVFHPHLVVLLERLWG